ncbi:ATP-binding protein [Syntrophotalea acetylenivorans]|uniref:ATP-binding protein n=1 Tax=Syntrophotalea acetylenivorans TaxID=1842532 RepID=UPI000AA1A738|nr:ATP-binding protein [Syntrophotalea acetylenivorans]
MDIERLDIDWEYVVERLDRILDLGEEYLTRRLVEYQLDPGIFRNYIAFRWIQHPDNGYLAEVAHPDLADHDELFGIDRILENLQRNTEQFVHNYPANNVLLWGERGCGKSAAIKGLLKLYFQAGLRLVEVQKEDLFQLPQITHQLRDQPYRFILFCDDLSFDEGEPGYRELYSLLEGGIEEPAGNILLYATSNRHYLLPDRLSDNSDGRHPQSEEAWSEKLSLDDLFGISLGFYPMSQPVYLEIVGYLAQQRRLIISEEELHSAALSWAMERGSRSGRVARQFMDDLSGRMAMEGKIAPLSD